MDFFQIRTQEARGKAGRDGVIEIYPDFIVGRSKDLMVKGKSFYAIWDEDRNLWSTDEYDVQRLVDEKLRKFEEEQIASGISCKTKYLQSFNTNTWSKFRQFLSNISDNSHPLDMNLTFANTEVKKTDYVSRRLPYPLAPGDHSAWDELVGVLYSEENRAKIEWAIGAVISGDSKKLQKFLVFYGPGGTGKSTILNIIQKLCGGLVSEGGYVTTFDAKALVGGNNSFATETFKGNPLVAIQHDGDLSRIEDNSKLNSIISHEDMPINEKFKPTYSSRINAFLFMGTNKPVKITDGKSGIIRRLIDVHPTGELIKPNRYITLMSKIDFELGAIAHHCLEVYRKMGKNYYSAYRPVEMMLQTDVFFNFVQEYYDVFKAQNGITLKQAYALYKEFCEDSKIDKPLPQYKFRPELMNYFDSFEARQTVDGVSVRSYFSGFSAKLFKTTYKNETPFSLNIDYATSLFDEQYSDQPAQYAKDDGTPEKYWTDEKRLIDGVLTKPKKSQVVSTVLSDLNTSELHFVRLPSNHIVIDFDLRDEEGKKSLEKNLEAASTWPPTYAELSKSGSGVHLHYIYDGDVNNLSPEYSDGIEVKVYRGNSSLRRKLTKCNNIPVATINSGLPIKEAKVLSPTSIKSEKGLRDLIARNLRKEIHPGTKPSIDFIHKILEDAYQSGMSYDVTDLRPKILAFANNSTNQALQCLKIVQSMRFVGAEKRENGSDIETASRAAETQAKDDRLVFFDVEVFPNLLVVCWKYAGSPNVVRMINPEPKMIEGLFQLKLVGFYNRQYDNHILYARFLGHDNQQIYELSKKIISNDKNATFSAAYNISYADIWEFSSKRQGLKKFEIDLGLHHMELDLPWDEPVPEEYWSKVVEYCVNDVIATEAVFNSRKQDFVARQIIAELSGLTVNDTTPKHTARIIFGEDKNPQKKFVYTNLSDEFPGYVYSMGESTYRGEVTGEGGYVYAEPGIYENVLLLDVASMHPTSIERLNLFGDYTKKFAELKEVRLAIKHGDFDAARKMLDGKLAPFLGDEKEASALSDALKIVINIVYGLTSAKFDNPFRDVRNKDNIVAKRGALFMIELKHFVEESGFQVVHIKTDSIKIPGAPDWLIEKIFEFGKQYGYDFEHEATYEKFCLVNDAVYVAKYGWAAKKDKIGTWTAVGAQFQHPYVFKTLFTDEPVKFEDLCETKQVTQGAMYLDFNHGKASALHQGTRDMHFIGRTGLFVPVTEEAGGAVLYRVKDDKPYAVTGTKGHLWLEAEMVKNMSPDIIDMSYFERLADDARDTIEKFGSFEEFVS